MTGGKRVLQELWSLFDTNKSAQGHLEKCGAGAEKGKGGRAHGRDGPAASIADRSSTRAVAGTCMFCECLNISLSGTV